MLAVPVTNAPSMHTQHTSDGDPFVVYARSLHDYTLRLWTESMRMAEERVRMKAAASSSAVRKQVDGSRASQKQGEDAKKLEVATDEDAPFPPTQSEQAKTTTVDTRVPVGDEALQGDVSGANPSEVSQSAAPLP